MYVFFNWAQFKSDVESSYVVVDILDRLAML